MKFRIKNTNVTLKIIGIYQIFGGILGLGITGWLLMNTGQINGPVLLIFLVAIGLYSLSIQAGRLIIGQNSIKAGIIYSMINHILQVFAISNGRYTYEYYSGLKGTFGFKFLEGFEFKFEIGASEFNFILNSHSEPIFLYINVFAIIVIALLYDIYKELFSKETQTPIADLGEENYNLRNEE